MVVIHRIVGMLTGLMLAALIAVSGVSLMRPPLGPEGPDPGPARRPWVMSTSTTQAPAPALHASVVQET
jgi:hypothetical protein